MNPVLFSVWLLEAKERRRYRVFTNGPTIEGILTRTRRGMFGESDTVFDPIGVFDKGANFAVCTTGNGDSEIAVSQSARAGVVTVNGRFPQNG
jgi:hypothetical protein